MIERTFFSVGQALFCREKVNKRTIIYDCGGQTMSIVEKVINEEYPQGGTSVIDALFISHYDRDHINGVLCLLNRCKVNHLFLPMVSPLSRFFSFYGQRYTGQFRAFYSDPKAYIQFITEDTVVHYVGQTYVEQSNENERDSINVDELGFRDLIGHIYILRFNDNPDWVYVPFNRKVMTQQEETQFLSMIGLPEDASFDDILSMWRKKRLSLKKVIKKMDVIDITHIDDYSMTLYSGSINSRNACLFLGDYNAKRYYIELHNAYNYLWKNICVIQVPHHGSTNNYSCNLCQDNTLYVVSNKRGPYSSRQVNPDWVIKHIKYVLEEPCYTTFKGHLIITEY